MEKPTLYAALKNIEGMHKAQRDTFERYRGNSFLEDAIRRERPLEEACNELCAPLSGWRGQLLPYFKDPVHNSKVEQMGELIPTNRFRKRGIYFPDNLAAFLSYGIAVLGMQQFALIIKPYSPAVGDYIMDSIPFMAAGMLVFPFMLLATIRMGFSPLAQANYIDSLIKELEIK